LCPFQRNSGTSFPRAFAQFVVMKQLSRRSILRGTLHALRHRSMIERASYRTPGRRPGSLKLIFLKNRDVSFGKMGTGVSAVAVLKLDAGAGAPLLSSFFCLPFPSDGAFLGSRGVSSFRRLLVPHPVASIVVSFV